MLGGFNALDEHAALWPELEVYADAERRAEEIAAARERQRSRRH